MNGRKLFLYGKRRALGWFPGLVPGEPMNGNRAGRAGGARPRLIAAAAGLLLFSAACTSASGPRKQVLNAPNIARLAPYSSSIRTGDLIFFSGVIGSRPGGGLAEGGVQGQTRQALENLTGVMTVAGVAREDIVKCTVFLADIADYAAMNEVYGAFFQPDPPARSAIGVAGLPAGARVEIECIAAAR
jgi:2-iminobutanoate/2-iminopropanoate deaminase